MTPRSKVSVGETAGQLRISKVQFVGDDLELTGWMGATQNLTPWGIPTASPLDLTLVKLPY